MENLANQKTPGLNRNRIQEALQGLVKLLQAVRYYPPRHPALHTASHEAQRTFAPLLKNGELAVAIRKNAILAEDVPLSTDNPQLQKLAAFLFAYRIHRLLLLPDLSAADLRRFARILSLGTATVEKRGGVKDLLVQAKVSTLWINEADPARIQSLKNEIEAQKQTLTPKQAEQEEEELLAPEEKSGTDRQAPQKEAQKKRTEEERELAMILRELRRTESKFRFGKLLQELVPRIRQNLTEEARPLVLQAMLFLCRNAATKTADNRRQQARQALRQLLADDVLDFLVAALCGRENTEESREKIGRMLAFLGERAARRLMVRLAAEEEFQARRYLAEALIRQKSRAVPVLLAYLDDERWYVVRNAVAILGEIRRPEAAGRLAPLIAHQDLRVRRETIRALTRIGGSEAEGILLQALENGDDELRRQALLSLGALRSTAAIPALVGIVAGPERSPKLFEMKKEAIRALGEIGSAEAVPPLSTLLRRRKFWRRAKHDELRAAAAAALGDIGDPEATVALEKAAEDSSTQVARNASQALNQIRKG